MQLHDEDIRGVDLVDPASRALEQDPRGKVRFYQADLRTDRLTDAFEGALPNAIVASPLRSYWQLHVSPLFLCSSMISYLVPLDRMDYFWLFQGIIYLPFGLSLGLLFAPEHRPERWTAMVGILLSSLCITFNGQAIACMGFPHYEIMSSAGVCIMLAALAPLRIATA